MVQSYWRTVSLVTTWQIAASICYYAVFAGTPLFRDAFGLTRFHVGIVVAVLTLGYATFLLPFGTATDRFGEHRILSLGLLGLALSIVLVSQAPTLFILLGTVFLLGTMYGPATPGTNKAIYRTVTTGRQNLALGIKQVGVTAGSGISALLVTGLASILFWQAGFLVAGGFALGVSILFYWRYPSSYEPVGRTHRQITSLSSNVPYLLLITAGFFLGAALFTTTGYVVLYVDEAIGATVFIGGVVLALVQFSGSLGRIIMGWLGDVLPGSPRKRIGGLLLGQTIAGSVLFLVVSQTTSTVGAVLAFTVLGFFVLGYTGVYFSCLATLVSAEDIGGASAGGQLTLTTGSLFAPPTFGLLADTFGYHVSWWFLSGICLLAAMLLLGVIRTPTPEKDPAVSV